MTSCSGCKWLYHFSKALFNKYVAEFIFRLLCRPPCLIVCACVNLCVSKLWIHCQE